MTSRKQSKIDEAELDHVRKVARAIALANGHSHSDEYAEKVVSAYKGELEPSDESESDAGEGGEASGGEA